MTDGSMSLDPKKVVAEGYNQIAEEYGNWASRVRTGERAKYTAVLLAALPAGAEVLELGCGQGIPTTRQLAGRFVVTGVDISKQQLARAQEKVPTARFVHADMAELDLPPSTFDGVAAFYSLIHVSRREQPELLVRIASWLRPGGLLVATMGALSIAAGYEEDFLGAPMYWSSFDSETNRRLVSQAGLQIVSAREETAEEFGEPVTFLWVIAQKPMGPGDRYGAA
jgi:ubiquinone/menaquinone biosynthesis C-methylase UbiE